MENQTDNSALVQCPACMTQFAVPADMLEASSSSKFHCSKCDGVFSLTEETDSAPPEITENYQTVIQTSSMPMDIPEGSELDMEFSENVPEQISEEDHAQEALEADDAFAAQIQSLIQNIPNAIDSNDEEVLTEQVEEPPAEAIHEVPPVFQQTPSDLEPTQSLVEPDNIEPTQTELFNHGSEPTFTEDVEPFSGSQIPLEIPEAEPLEETSMSESLDHSEDDTDVYIPPRRTPLVNELTTVPSGFNSTLDDETVELQENHFDDSPFHSDDLDDMDDDFSGTTEIIRGGAHSGVVAKNARAPGFSSVLLLSSPIVLFLAALVGASYLMRAHHPVTDKFVHIASSSGPSIAPPGLRLLNPSFRRVSLASGESIHVIAGELHNSTEQTFNKILVDGYLFDGKGSELEHARLAASSALGKARLTDLSVDLIKDIETNNSESEPLRPGKSQRFALTFFGDDISQAKFYTTRVFSVEY